MNLNVAMLVSELFSPHAAATITSVVENNSNINTTFYLFTIDFSENTICKYKQLASLLKTEIKIVKLEQKEIDSLPISGRWGFYALGRLIIIKKLAETLDKVLILGADVIVEKSLAEIITLNIEDYAFAGAEDMVNCIKHKKRLNLDFYMLNLAYWRRNNMIHKCFNFVKNNANKIQVGDQDVINSVCVGKIKCLPIEYNMQSPYYFHKPQILSKYLPLLKPALKSPIAIHFSEYVKPWHFESKHPLSHRYWFYLEKTPWKNLKKTYWSKRPYLHIPKLQLMYLLHNLDIKKYDNFYDKV
jgi:lipopolysaccharide biosynthesis glycosyltransferase